MCNLKVVFRRNYRALEHHRMVDKLLMLVHRSPPRNDRRPPAMHVPDVPRVDRLFVVFLRYYIKMSALQWIKWCDTHTKTSIKRTNPVVAVWKSRVDYKALKYNKHRPKRPVNCTLTISQCRGCNYVFQTKSDIREVIKCTWDHDDPPGNPTLVGLQ